MKSWCKGKFGRKVTRKHEEEYCKNKVENKSCN